MTPNFRALALPLAGLLALGGNTAYGATDKLFDELVKSERDFAASSVQHGAGAAFRANLATDAILFRPGPVFGQVFFDRRQDQPITLNWAPEAAELSAAGDFGYTYGPWQIRSTKDPAAAPSWGHYFTVWQRDADGLFRVVFDSGVGHADTVLATTVKQRGATAHAGKPISPREREHRVQTLLSADRRLNEAMTVDGAGDAWVAALTDDVALLRNGALPQTGREAAQKLAPKAPQASMDLDVMRIAASGDLAATAAHHKIDDNTVEHYARIWRYEGGDWRIAVDLRVQ